MHYQNTRSRPRRKTAAEQAASDLKALLDTKPRNTFEWIRWALLLPVPHGQKLVLAFIASRGGNDGTGAFPSKAMLAFVIMRDEKTVHRHLLALQNLGLLSWEKRNSTKGRESNLYELHWKSPTDILPSPNGHPAGAQRTSEGTPTDTLECPRKTQEEEPPLKTTFEELFLKTLFEGPSRVRAQGGNNQGANGAKDAKVNRKAPSPQPRFKKERPRPRPRIRQHEDSLLPDPGPTDIRECPLGPSDSRPEDGSTLTPDPDRDLLARARAVVAVAAEHGVGPDDAATDLLAAAAELTDLACAAWDQDVRGPEVEAILRAAGFQIDRDRLIAPEPVA